MKRSFQVTAPSTDGARNVACRTKCFKEKGVKKLFLTIFTLALAALCLPKTAYAANEAELIEDEDADRATAETGTCGTGLTWELDDDHKLTIRGTGEIDKNGLGETAQKATTLVIEEGVTAIGDNAFYLCISLREVTLPKSLTKIGMSAFSQCYSLNNIVLPENITELGYRAFGDCANLTTVALPENITKIGHSAFQGCTKLTGVTLPENLKIIDDYAFYECSSLTEMDIPKNVTKIGDLAFYGCSGLTEMTIPESMTEIGVSAFENCSLTKVTIPKNVTKMGRFAFGGNKLKTAGPGGIDGIYDINFGWTTEIPANAFWGCSTLTDVAIPKGINGINASTFALCSSLTKAVIPKGAEYIDESAFSGCSSLAEVTIPEGVLSIGYSAFSGCSSLTEVIIPEGVTEIDQCAFNGCSSLKKMTIPKSVTKIGGMLFSSGPPYTVHLHVVAGSYAESYAKKEGIPYTATGSPAAPAKNVQNIHTKYNTNGQKLEWAVGSKYTQVVTGAKTPVTFTSSNPKAAKVDKKSGVITCVGVGKTVITAKAAETSEYKAASKQFTLHVIPKTPKISLKRSNKKGQVTIKSTSATKGNDGYQIQYKYNGKTKTVKIKSSKALDYTLKNLKPGKTIKVRVCAYKKVNGTTYNGKSCKWTTLKKI